MQHLEDSGTPVLYMGRTVLKRLIVAAILIPVDSLRCNKFLDILYLQYCYLFWAFFLSF